MTPNCHLKSCEDLTKGRIKAIRNYRITIILNGGSINHHRYISLDYNKTNFLESPSIIDVAEILLSEC